MKNYLGALIAVLVCAIVAWFGSDGGTTFAGFPVFAWCAVISLLVNWVMFAHAWLERTELYYDLTGSITYISVLTFALVASGNFDLRSLIIAACIYIWAVRLGTFLFKRVREAGEDKRFRAMKKSFSMFFMTWTLQGTWVFITAGCALAAITSLNGAQSSALLFIGLAIWAAGFAIEVVADAQKSAFRAQPENEDAFIQSGLWAWSRHPNYFGEITLWIGVAVMAFPALSGGQLATLISPVFVVFLLTMVSGVRMLEERGDKKWGDDPEYQAYKERTPVLIPMPPKTEPASA